MRLLAVAAIYPHPGHKYSGIFNQRCVQAAVRNGHEVTALVPRPYLPGFLSLHKRWAAYAQIPQYERQGAVEIHRPKLIMVPKIASTFWRCGGAYLQCRGVARKLHRETPFDAILSFDLSAAGGVAWRLSRHLGIPASGWAFGLDVRPDPQGSEAKELRRMLKELDLIFYQSQELLDCAQSFLPDHALAAPKHVVLPHGIPKMSRRSDAFRDEMRQRLKIPHDAKVVLFLGRFVRGKGLEELVEAFAKALTHDPQLYCLAVGSQPGFDDTELIYQKFNARTDMSSRFQLLPGCAPAEIADYHACADIFAFPSHSEGMPNALLEAMALSTPSVAFAIPPICEIPDYQECMVPVPPLSVDGLAEGLLKLAASPELSAKLAAKAESVVKTQFDIDANVGLAVDKLGELVSDGRPQIPVWEANATAS